MRLPMSKASAIKTKLPLTYPLFLLICHPHQVRSSADDFEDHYRHRMANTGVNRRRQRIGEKSVRSTSDDFNDLKNFNSGVPRNEAPSFNGSRRYRDDPQDHYVDGEQVGFGNRNQNGYSGSNNNKSHRYNVGRFDQDPPSWWE